MKEIALEQVTTTHRLAEAATANRLVAITLARNLGLSWHEIGEAMGLSRQAVHKRFGTAVGEPRQAIVKATARLERFAHADGDGAAGEGDGDVG